MPTNDNDQNTLPFPDLPSSDDLPKISAREMNGHLELLDNTGRVFKRFAPRRYRNATGAAALPWHVLFDDAMDYLHGRLSVAKTHGDREPVLIRHIRQSIFDRRFHSKLELACRRAIDNNL